MKVNIKAKQKRYVVNPSVPAVVGCLPGIKQNEDK